MNFDKCPNCGKSVKGYFSSATLISDTKVEFINKHLGLTSVGYCTICSVEYLSQLARNFAKQKSELEARLEQIIHYIPVLTSPAPQDWKYEPLSMVNAQTTSGTGFATEFSRSINDFFGGSSNTTNRKILEATRLCKSDLRIQCIKMGGNAVISSDIDFNEIGAGSTNMLMVCMAGTAIKVFDLTVFNSNTRDYIAEVIEVVAKLEAISIETS